MTKNYLIIAILTLIMVGALIYAFTSSGSPFDTRNRKLDDTRVTNLTNLKYSIDNYYSKNSALPEKLGDVFSDSNSSSLNSYYQKDLKDPESSNEYDYYKKDNTSYQLCASFSTASSTLNQTNSSVYLTNQTFEHPKGHYCFDLKVTTPKYQTYN